MWSIEGLSAVAPACFLADERVLYGDAGAGVLGGILMMVLPKPADDEGVPAADRDDRIEVYSDGPGREYGSNHVGLSIARRTNTTRT